MALDFSRRRKPTNNPFIESLIGSFQDECLNVNWFVSLEDNRIQEKGVRTALWTIRHIHRYMKDK